MFGQGIDVRFGRGIDVTLGRGIDVRLRLGQGKPSPYVCVVEIWMICFTEKSLVPHHVVITEIKILNDLEIILI
jgi:hypothetical protein